MTFRCMTQPHLYLASLSPRRQELLTQLGLRYELIAQAVPEQCRPDESPETYVRRLALEKAWAGLAALAGRVPRPVLGADTTVVVDDAVLGKPADEAEAKAMLMRLSGRSHRVLSAVAVVGRDDLGQDRQAVRVSQSRVTFRDLSTAECHDYWHSGEPVDKAGAYAIQGLGALFVARLEGSYSGVMGLPLFETGELLRLFGIDVLHLAGEGT
jgi:septum formation protein